MSCLEINNKSNLQRGYTNIINNFFISFCFFQRINTYIGTTSDYSISTSSSGGVMYFYYTLTNLSVKDSIFFNCSSSGNGGCIFYYSPIENSETLIERVCGYSCWCGLTFQDPFSITLIKDDCNHYNKYLFVSISKCSPYYSYCYSSIFVQYGNQSIKSTNSSNNNVKGVSGIRIAYPSCFLGSHNSFLNGNSSEYSSIYFNRNTNNLLQFSNIINNNSPLSNYGIVFIENGIYNISNCIFFNNYNNLFYISNNCKLNVFDSIIIHNNLKLTTGLANLININTQNSKTMNLIHYSTFLCFGNNNFSTQNFKKSFFPMITIILIIF